MVIDGHTHIFVEGGPALADFSNPETTLARMDQDGVDKVLALIAFDNDDFTQEKVHLLNKYRERFLLFAWLDPRQRETAEKLEYCIDQLGFTGLKLHPLMHQYDITESGLLNSVLEVCNRKQLHVIIHCTSGYPNCTPEKIEMLAKKYHNATFQIAHSGAIYDGNKAIAVASRTDNLYLDTGIASTNCIRRAVLTCPEKIIMGCDWPSYTFEQEMLKVRSACQFAGKPEYYRDIIGGNIARLLKIKEDY